MTDSKYNNNFVRVIKWFGKNEIKNESFIILSMKYLFVQFAILNMLNMSSILHVLVPKAIHVRLILLTVFH